MTLALDPQNGLLAWNGAGSSSCCETISVYKLSDLQLLKRQEILVLPDAMRDHLCYSPNGKFLFAWGGMAYSSDGIDVYDADSLKFLWSHYLDQPSDRIVFSPDGKHVAIVAGCKHKISILDIESGSLVKNITCFAGKRRVSDLARFSQDGSCISTVEDDFVSKINIETEEEVERRQISINNAWMSRVWENKGKLRGLSFDNDSGRGIYWIDFQHQSMHFPIPSRRWNGDAVSINGRYFAVTADYSLEKEPWPIYLFDLETG